MTAPFAQSQFATSNTRSHLDTATMWRGAAIGIFADLEATVLACLADFEAAESLKPKAGDFVAWQRFKRLATILEQPRFAPWNAKALRLLAEIERDHELRIGLAHGRMKATAWGMTLNWQALEKEAWQPRSATMRWLEALEVLHRLDKLQRDLASQFGQIRRHCLQVD